MKKILMLCCLCSSLCSCSSSKETYKTTTEYYTSVVVKTDKQLVWTINYKKYELRHTIKDYVISQDTYIMVGDTYSAIIGKIEDNRLGMCWDLQYDNFKNIVWHTKV